MKTRNLFIVPLFLLTLQHCNAVDSNIDDNIQIVEGDDSAISDSLKALFKEDAARLSLRVVYSKPSDKENLIILPDDKVESYYRGLVHIYNANYIHERDLVIETYKIHAFRYPETHRLSVSVDSTKDWVQEWKNGNRLTGNQQVDNLMETYNLQLYHYYSWPNLNVAELISEKPLNIYALCNKFKPVEGVIYSEPDGTVGDGNDITGNIESGGIKFIFSFGWGDCPAGCISRHYWEFSVRSDGAVQFINSYGDPL
jgi:hypothetical protein